MNDTQRNILAVVVVLAGLAVTIGMADEAGSGHGWSGFEQNWHVYFFGFIAIGAIEYWLFRDKG